MGGPIIRRSVLRPIPTKAGDRNANTDEPFDFEPDVIHCSAARRRSLTLDLRVAEIHPGNVHRHLDRSKSFGLRLVPVDASISQALRVSHKEG
jgi:hypothetical protein